MTDFSTANLRTVALVGHGAAGKTSLAEQLLAKSKMIGAAGSVEKGSTVSDFDPLERSALRLQRRAHPSDRHAGLSGFPGTGDRQSRRGGDGGGRRERYQWHRAGDAPDDGLGEEPQSVPRAGRQQDRSREYRPADTALGVAGGLRL